MREPQRQSSNGAKRQAVDESKRRDLKRLAALVGLAFVAASLPLAATGCRSTKNQKESKTLDDFLAADKPSY